MRSPEPTAPVMARVVFLALLLGLAALPVSCSSAERIALGRDPPTLLTTNPFAVGDRYTLGMTGPDEASVQPVRITAVEVVHAAGVEVVGVGVIDVTSVGEGIGLVPGWPPDGYELAAIDEMASAQQWQTLIHTVVGIEITERVAGLRGVEVRWVDREGASHSKVFDIAVLTCPAGSCDGDDEAQEALQALGLTRP